MSILVTGGAGFIGRHTIKLLHAHGMETVALDNLSTGRRDSTSVGAFVEGDIADVRLVRKVLRDHAVTAVVHLAASAHVGDSMAHPDAYYRNNVCGTSALLEAMHAEDVRQLIFASSCSVYGNSASTAAHEEEAVIPMSPYGESKLVTERALPWYHNAFGLSWIALRYFNVAGAEDAMGEDLVGCRRIIPRTVHAAVGGGPALGVFGTNFDTVDGSAVRDFVHVSDVANANLLALKYVGQGKPPLVINIAAGVGTSVLQIIAEVGHQTGQTVPHKYEAARGGDPGCAIADISRARHELGWAPVNSGLDNIVSSTLRSATLRAQLEQAT